jgi:hypothetical protein
MALLLAGLIVVALIIKHWVVNLAAIGSLAAVHGFVRVADRHRERVEAERRRLAGLRGRAEAQHNWTLMSADCGVNIRPLQSDSRLITQSFYR